MGCREGGGVRSGMLFPGASTNVPASPEASGADGGSPELVWNGELAAVPPWEGRALLACRSASGDVPF